MQSNPRPIQGFKVYGIAPSPARDVVSSARRVALAVVILSPLVAAFVVAFGGAL